MYNVFRWLNKDDGNLPRIHVHAIFWRPPAVCLGQHALRVVRVAFQGRLPSWTGFGGVRQSEQFDNVAVRIAEAEEAERTFAYDPAAFDPVGGYASDMFERRFQIGYSNVGSDAAPARLSRRVGLSRYYSEKPACDVKTDESWRPHLRGTLEQRLVKGSRAFNVIGKHVEAKTLDLDRRFKRRTRRCDHHCADHCCNKRAVDAHFCLVARWNSRLSQTAAATMLSASFANRSRMRRADRLFEIIQILRRTREPVTAQAIANELEVSKRSVYRDVAALIAQRVPVTGEAGIGYVLERGFDMPPLMLTSDEVDAAILGAHWVASRGEPEMIRAAASLLAKIEAVLPERLRGQISEPSTSVAPVAQAVEAVSSAKLRFAIRSGRKVALRYRAAGGETSERIVWPVLLGYRDAGRILAAWCEMRAGFRYFRTDRMADACVLDEAVPERRARLRERWRAAMDEERALYEQAD